MAFLSRDEIFAKDDLSTKDVPVPEWGEGAEVRIKMLTGTQRDSFESSMVKIGKDGSTTPNLENARARLVRLCAVEVNEDGSTGDLLFPDKNDVIRLGNKSSAALSRLYDECNTLNGFTEADVQELEAQAGGDGDAEAE